MHVVMKGFESVCPEWNAFGDTDLRLVRPPDTYYYPNMHHTDEQTRELWREQCRRQLRRPMSARLKYGFVSAANRERVNRSFATMKEYREWCERSLPAYLGYGSANAAPKV